MDKNNTENQNKKLAKSSAFLYVRLLITTLIGILSSRIIFNALGPENFGLFLIVGGIVSLMNILNSSMISTSNRFISIELGKQEKGKLGLIFNTLFIIHLLLAVFLILLGESIGRYYILNFLKVSKNLLPDALNILHFSLLSTALLTIIVPFQALITSHENFKTISIIEIFQSITNLIFVIIMSLFVENKLFVFSLLSMVNIVIVSIIYYLYCLRKYPLYIQLKFYINKKNFILVLKYKIWILIGVMGSMTVKQISAIIINSFFGTIINASFGIASRINEYLWTFVKNLNQAAVPQIMKSHGSGDKNRSMDLLYNLSKYTFFVLLVPTVPILFSIDKILYYWLGSVPNYTTEFAIIMLIHGLVSCLVSGFDPTIQATGKIKIAQISYSIITIITIPVTILMFKLNFPPYTISIIFIFSEITNLIVQTRILKKLVDFKIVEYIKVTLIPIFFVIICILPTILLNMLFGETFIEFLIFSLLSIIFTLLVINYVGLNDIERTFMKNMVLNKIKNKV